MEAWSISKRPGCQLGAQEALTRKCKMTLAVSRSVSTFLCTQQGKQTEPWPWWAWLVLPPLLWVILREREQVSMWGMELALTGVDFTSSKPPRTPNTSTPAWTQLQPTPETMSEQPVSNVLQVENVSGLRSVSWGRRFCWFYRCGKLSLSKWCLSTVINDAKHGNLMMANYILIRTEWEMWTYKRYRSYPL